MSKNSLIKGILKANQRRVDEFTKPDFLEARRLHMAKYPLNLIMTRCSDGRMNHLPEIMGLPFGVIETFQNIGGKFTFGWPSFYSQIEFYVTEGINEGRPTLFFVTYHFSETHHLNCRGADYNACDAKRYTQELIEQAEFVYGKKHHTLYPIQVGVNTDKGSLVFDSGEESFDISKNINLSNSELRASFRRLYAGMPAEMLDVLVHVAKGNQNYLSDISNAQKLVRAEHKEQGIALGRGLDFVDNDKLLIIGGAYGYDLGDPMRKACAIIQENWEQGRISKEDGFVLMASGLYGKKHTKEVAILEAQSSADTLFSLAYTFLPKHIFDSVHVLVGITDENTKQFSRIEFNREEQIDKVIAKKTRKQTSHQMVGAE